MDIVNKTECLCVGCSAQNPTSLHACESCGTDLRLVKRFTLHSVVDDVSAALDDAGTLYEAYDHDNRRAVLLRVARYDDEGIARESRLLKGLKIKGIPEVIEAFDFGQGSALVMRPPLSSSSSLASHIDEGLRFTSERARSFLRSCLKLLVELETLSPPVHHRNISPSTLIYDGVHVGLRDFARASQTMNSRHEKSLVAIGYASGKEANALERDLYGIAASVIHVLSHVEPASLLVKGRLQFEHVVNIDLPLALFLKEMLEARFKSAKDALAALPSHVELPKKEAKPERLVWVAGGLFVALLTAVSGFIVLGEESSPNVAVDVTQESKVRITTFPPGAALSVDGKSVGKTPAHVLLNHGNHALKVVLRKEVKEKRFKVRGPASLHIDFKK